MEKHLCAGDYIEWCIDTGAQPPYILHGVPLTMEQLWLMKGDDQLTLYPGAELPASVLALIKNTRLDREWSEHLWGNIFFTKVVQFLQNHKGGVIDKRMPFCVLAMHSTNPHYHLFHQHYYISNEGSHNLGFHQETYVKSSQKCTFDAILCFMPRVDADGHDVDGYDMIKMIDPKGLFTGDANLPPSLEELI
jgi:hypothetical protein